MECIKACQTFLSGGTVPMIDGTGSCSCICGEKGWSEFNILGQASCVPIQAHVIFGALGLATSVASLSHAAYQLNRQVGESSCYIVYSKIGIVNTAVVVQLIPLAPALLVNVQFGTGCRYVLNIVRQVVRAQPTAVYIGDCSDVRKHVGHTPMQKRDPIPSALD